MSDIYDSMTNNHDKIIETSLREHYAAPRGGTVGEVIDQRKEIYGEPVETFARIAHMWSAILDHEIQPHEVPLLLMGMKLVRTQVTPDYSDNSDDIEGYLDIFRTLIGDSMIHARLTSEYAEKKWGKA